MAMSKPYKVYDLITNRKRSVDEVMNLLKLSQSEIEYIDKLTVDQSASSEWKDYRYGRITASIVGMVIKAVNRESYPKYLFDRLQGTQDLSFIPAVRWGRENEKLALNAFAQLYPELIIQSRGLILHSNGIIGGSPDGVVVEKINGIYRDDAIIEIKCSHKYKECSNLYDAIIAEGDKNFYIDAETRKLKRMHDYWHQIQCMMWVTNTSYSFFIVWTPNAPLHVEKINRVSWWAEVNIPKIEKFYYDVYLPHMILNTPISSEVVNKRMWNEEDVLSEDLLNEKRSRKEK
jgi:YqaJ-like viral recombinase domain